MGFEICERFLWGIAISYGGLPEPNWWMRLVAFPTDSPEIFSTASMSHFWLQYSPIQITFECITNAAGQTEPADNWNGFQWFGILANDFEWRSK